MQTDSKHARVPLVPFVLTIVATACDQPPATRVLTNAKVDTEAPDESWAEVGPVRDDKIAFIDATATLCSAWAMTPRCSARPWGSVHVPRRHLTGLFRGMKSTNPGLLDSPT